jgi:SAM-dependent methyltransferase
LTFVVPPQFLRNSPPVLDLGPPADVGVALIDYMCRRLGLPSLAGLDLLDFGCGTRFADAILNRGVPLRSYTGIDVDRELIAFLNDNAKDWRLTFRHLDARNPHYNPDGAPLSPVSVLPVGEWKYDVICLFSVITHLAPDEARAVFSMLRKVVRPRGQLFFTVCVDDASGQQYVAGDPAGGEKRHHRYSAAHLRRLLGETGWRVESVEGPAPEGLPMLDSWACRPG